MARAVRPTRAKRVKGSSNWDRQWEAYWKPAGCGQYEFPSSTNGNGEFARSFGAMYDVGSARFIER